MGILVEKQEKSYGLATSHFNKAIEISLSVPIKTDHFMSLAYCGLARINIENHNYGAACDHYKKA